MYLLNCDSLTWKKFFWYEGNFKKEKKRERERKSKIECENFETN